MKKISVFFFLTMMLTVFSSCNSKKTYSELQKEEVIMIDSYIKRNNINVVTTMPAIDQWGANTYYKSSTGLYFHLVSPGDTTISLAAKSKVALRYVIYDVSEAKKVIMDLSNVVQSSYPDMITYGDYTYGSAGLHEAVGYMKYHNSVADVIIPSDLNTGDFNKNVTPVLYENLTIKLPQ